MKTPRKDGELTRQNLLSAGSDIFAAKGYRDTTIAEICERAGASNAAINYHFRDKKTLYRESWHHAFLKSLEFHPPDGGVGDDAPLEERLRGQVTALLHRAADKDSKELAIVVKEFANPTGLLKQIMRVDISPLHKRLAAVVCELLGGQPLDTEVRFCVLSILAQCMNGAVAGVTKELAWDDEECPPRVDDIEAYVDHVVTFSLAGISAIRKMRRYRAHGDGGDHET